MLNAESAESKPLSAVRYFKETACEHGDYTPGPHKHVDCPGGTRQEITIDYEAAAARLADQIAMSPPFHAMTAEQCDDYMKVALAIIDAALVVEPLDR